VVWQGRQGDPSPYADFGGRWERPASGRGVRLIPSLARMLDTPTL
jgi:hypothetical protein